MFKCALISVSDKTGLDTLVASLAKAGTQIVSTGGTADYIRKCGHSVKDVSDWTGFPEVMDGRVKTLHPRIHMAILARPNNKQDNEVLKKNDLEPFDLVVVNLYPFEKKPSIETIDIGGPSLLRAAAKTHERIVTLCDPKDYKKVTEASAGLDLNTRKFLAAKCFRHVSAYDSMIASWLHPELMEYDYSWGGHLVQKLRYGENPQQSAFWFQQSAATTGLHQAQILHGKALSYNNLIDLTAAVRMVRCLPNDKCVAVAVKHTNPCGVAIDESIDLAIEGALKADPKSVFGGIIATNQCIDEKAAIALKELFLECIVAPKFSDGAFKLLSKKKDIRLLSWPDLMQQEGVYEMRSIDGGLLVQEAMQIPKTWGTKWEVMGQAPDENTKNDLLLALQVCANLKSNAIAIVQANQTKGLGMGQVNRVDAVKQAIARWKEFHPSCENAVLASDAFFPFPDSVELIASSGAKWIIQPGGSVRDKEVLARAKELKINMVLTGERYFNH